jgi:carbamoyl-phosphate synthase large subunit
VGADGFDPKVNLTDAEGAKDKLRHELKVPGPERIWYIGDAFRHGFFREVLNTTAIDPWFLIQIEDIIKAEEQVKL